MRLAELPDAVQRTQYIDLHVSRTMMPIRAVEINYLPVSEAQFDNRRLRAPAGTAIINHRESHAVAHRNKSICDLSWT